MLKLTLTRNICSIFLGLQVLFAIVLLQALHGIRITIVLFLLLNSGFKYKADVSVMNNSSGSGTSVQNIPQPMYLQ